MYFSEWVFTIYTLPKYTKVIAESPGITFSSSIDTTQGLEAYCVIRSRCSRRHQRHIPVASLEHQMTWHYVPFQWYQWCGQSKSMRSAAILENSSFTSSKAPEGKDTESRIVTVSHLCFGLRFLIICSITAPKGKAFASMSKRNPSLNILFGGRCKLRFHVFGRKFIR